MSLHIATDTKSQLGGGITFKRQLETRLDTVGINDAKTILIPGATMVERKNIAKQIDKRIILRVDNYLKHSRNRGAGMTKMVDLAQMAETIVFQSRWSRKYLEPYLKSRNVKAKSVVIHNGSEERIYNKEHFRPDNIKRYLYVASSTDQSKGWVMAHQKFQSIHRKERAELWLVGKFDRAVRENNFDFFNNEKIRYLGIVGDPYQMAKIYKSCHVLLYSYFMDACSNTLNEALLCGMEIVDCYGMLKTGGAPEVVDIGGRTLTTMCYDYRKLIEGI